MKKYIKPVIIDEYIEIEDIMVPSTPDDEEWAYED